MKHMKITKTAVLLATASLLTLGTIGCNCSNDLKACQQQNEALAQQVSELEYQLQLADQAAVQAPVAAAPTFTEATYLVVQGDTLWSIAAKQLGDGKRYKEILALNPQLTQNTPLTIGTKLKIPAQ